MWLIAVQGLNSNSLAPNQSPSGLRGEKFVSVWVESRTAIWTRDVALDGTLGEESVAVSGDHTWPKLTFGPGPELLLTSVHWEMFSRTRRIESRFVGADGTVLPTKPIELDATDSTTEEITTSGDATSASSANTGSNVNPAPSSDVGTSAAPASTAVSDTSTTRTSSSTTATSSATPTSDPDERSAETDTKDSAAPAAKKKSSGCSVGVPNDDHSSVPWLSVAAFAALFTYFSRRAPSPTTGVSHRRPRFLRR